MYFIDDENIYKFDNIPLLKTKINDSILNMIKSQENLYLKDINIISPCFDENDKEVSILKDLYKNEFVSKKWEGHYDKIKKSVSECPYCGFGEITEIDHFLPKYLYPEFILFYYNLVPSCHNCNKSKLTKIINIHPYIHKIDILNVDLFKLEIIIEKTNLVFRYNINDNIDKNIKQFIEILKLSERYSMAANSLFNNDRAYYKRIDYDGLYNEIRNRYETSTKIHLRYFYKSILDDFQKVYNYIMNN